MFAGYNRQKLMDGIDDCIRDMPTIDTMSKLLLSAKIEHFLKECEKEQNENENKELKIRGCL